jgi:hypothetical protein
MYKKEEMCSFHTCASLDDARWRRRHFALRRPDEECRNEQQLLSLRKLFRYNPTMRTLSSLLHVRRLQTPVNTSSRWSGYDGTIHYVHSKPHGYESRQTRSSGLFRKVTAERREVVSENNPTGPVI